MTNVCDFGAELTEAIATNVIGIATMKADRIVEQKMGALCGWMAGVGNDGCQSSLLMGLESEFDGLVHGARKSIVIPGVRGISPRPEVPVTTTIAWIEQSGKFLVVSTPDVAIQQNEAFLESERRSRRLIEEQLEAVGAEVRFATVARERLRLARDLHDTLAHSIVTLLAQIRLIRRLTSTDTDQAAAELAKAEKAAIEGLARVRRTIANIRAPESETTNFWDETEEILQELRQRTQANIQFKIDDSARSYVNDHAHVIHRIITEAVRNIERHADARNVTVVAEIITTRTQAELHVTISDDGNGFDPIKLRPGHFGMIGMTELAALAGGRCEIDSRRGSGTVVRLRIPVRFTLDGPIVRSIDVRDSQ